MTVDEFSERYGPAALVTGASSGIGRAFAQRLAARGLDLVLVARRADRLHQLADDLRAAHGVTVTVCAADLADPGAPGRILAAASAHDIGLLISNAGFGAKGAFETGEAAAYASMLTVNCHAPTQLAHGVLPGLKARGRGGVLFTSSVEGLLGCPFSAVYSATKAYVTALGEALWGELAGTGVDVLTLCPGATDTEAPRLQGVDPTTLTDLKSPDEVAGLALDNLANGPTYIPSEHYRTQFDTLLALPRATALTAMAGALREAAGG